MSQLNFDERVIADLEILYRSRDVRRRRALVLEALAPAPGEAILDVGCGPGFYVAEAAEAVGSGGSVTGVDQSPDSLAAAARRVAGHPHVTLLEGDALQLPVPDATFDAALSVQVMEYVGDATFALTEMHRALRPGGRVLVWDVDWGTVSWHSADQERMARVLQAWDAHLVHPSLPRTLGARLRAVGFTDVEATGHVFSTDELSGETYGGYMTRIIEGFTARRPEIGPDVAAAWAAEQRDLAATGEFFFTCVQFCFTARRP
jgi:ubiquinone/menaquinone biosynthesis C-methylase UbiE